MGHIIVANGLDSYSFNMASGISDALNGHLFDADDWVHVEEDAIEQSAVADHAQGRLLLELSLARTQEPISLVGVSPNILIDSGDGLASVATGALARLCSYMTAVGDLLRLVEMPMTCWFLLGHQALWAGSGGAAESALQAGVLAFYRHVSLDFGGDRIATTLLYTFPREYGEALDGHNRIVVDTVQRLITGCQLTGARIDRVFVDPPATFHP